MYLQYKNYINGRWVESKGTKQFEIINPVIFTVLINLIQATQELVGHVPQSTDAEFNEAC